MGQGIRPNSEFSRRASRLTSLVLDPPNGRVPALTKEAQEERAAWAEEK